MHIHEVLPQKQIQQPKSQLLPKQLPPLDCKRREKRKTKQQQGTNRNDTHNIQHGIYHQLLGVFFFLAFTT